MKKQNVYEEYLGSQDLERYAAELIKQAKLEEKIIEEDPKKLKHMVSNDIRSSVSPQIYELIGLFTSAIEKIESKKTSKGERNES